MANPLDLHRARAQVIEGERIGALSAFLAKIAAECQHQRLTEARHRAAAYGGATQQQDLVAVRDGEREGGVGAALGVYRSAQRTTEIAVERMRVPAGEGIRVGAQRAGARRVIDDGKLAHGRQSISNCLGFAVRGRNYGRLLVKALLVSVSPMRVDVTI